jgi:SAM-dependent methyltransferase
VERWRVNPSSTPKPSHLGHAYADQFGDAAVVAAYAYRPPYPAETFDVLSALLAGRAGTVLDLGCGTGDLARRLAARVTAVDAIDCAPAMLTAGRQLPGGEHPHLTWLLGDAATAALPRRHYDLAVAGESLHWMEWAVLLPRLAALVPPPGSLVLVSRREHDLPWRAALQPLIDRYTTNREFQPYNLVEELTRRRLFAVVGEQATPPVRFRQEIADYIEAMHSRNGFSRDRMDPAEAVAFDAAYAALLRPYAADDMVDLQVSATLTWGNPLNP